MEHLTAFLSQKFNSPLEALTAIIEHLDKEGYDPKHPLDMNSYEGCMITYLNGGNDWAESEKEILNDFLGIDLTFNDEAYFCENRHPAISQETWKYFRFFTYEVQHDFAVNEKAFLLENWVSLVTEMLNSEM